MRFALALLIFALLLFVCISCMHSKGDARAAANRKLFQAIEKLDDKGAEQALKEGADPNAKSPTGHSALILACGPNGYEIVRSLVKAGANVNQSDSPYNVTPLHMACANNEKSIVIELIEDGADLEAKTTSGRTPLESTTDREIKFLISDAISRRKSAASRKH